MISLRLAIARTRAINPNTAETMEVNKDNFDLLVRGVSLSVRKFVSSDRMGRIPFSVKLPASPKSAAYSRPGMIPDI